MGEKIKSEDCILLVGEETGYMLTSIKEKLNDIDLDVIIIGEISEIEGLTRPISAILIYADELVTRNQKLLVYLKDKATEEGLPIFTVGNDEDLIAIRKLVTMVQKEFKRPVNVKNMTLDIKTYLEAHDKKKKLKILAVDDSGIILNNIKNWLGDKYQVMLADSGLSAIKCMTLNRPDLILLDYEMPVCDGRQTLAMIRENNEFKDIPVIFLTGKQDKQSILQVMDLKPEGYLLKTMKPVDVVRNIDEFFEKQKARRR